MIITPILQQLVTEVDEKQKSVTRQLLGFPEGRLIQTRNNRRPLILFVTGHGKTRCRKSVTGNRAKQIDIAREQILLKEISELKLQKDVLCSAVEALKGHEEFSRMRYAADNFGWLSDQELVQCCASDLNDGWADEPYEKSDYMPQNLNNMTSRGLLVRSKSELLIAEMLYKYDIPFRYEQVYRTDKYFLVADFTIKRSDGKIFIWEHQGMINSRSYIDWQRRKSELYAGLGFFPWNNMIVTYDTEDGKIDLRLVESEIRNKLII